METGLRTTALSGSGTYGFQILAHWYQVSKSKEVAPWMPLPNPQPKMYRCVYVYRCLRVFWKSELEREKNMVSNSH